MKPTVLRSACSVFATMYIVFTHTVQQFLPSSLQSCVAFAFAFALAFASAFRTPTSSTSCSCIVSVGGLGSGDGSGRDGVAKESDGREVGAAGDAFGSAMFSYVLRLTMDVTDGIQNDCQLSLIPFGKCGGFLVVASPSGKPLQRFVYIGHLGVFVRLTESRPKRHCVPLLRGSVAGPRGFGKVGT
ncbi:hypothetical protein BC832DRAFT_465894 [Gaertneriomyces semiglobifer]|nr:hypothetical protein BC832DRAFT_465894 [Gaertneriomyces semiglobifer]